MCKVISRKINSNRGTFRPRCRANNAPSNKEFLSKHFPFQESSLDRMDFCNAVSWARATQVLEHEVSTKAEADTKGINSWKLPTNCTVCR